MAVALVIFARWNPMCCLCAALLFGGAGALGPALQSVGVTSGYYLFNAAPYVLTLLILILTSSRAAASPARRSNDASALQGSNMSGLGGLNKSPNGVVIGLVQLQLPVVATPDDSPRRPRGSSHGRQGAAQSRRRMDLVVFPEYSLHGLSMDTNPEIMCRSTGPRWRRSSAPAATIASGAASRSWSSTRAATRTTAASSSTTAARSSSTTASCTPGCRSSRGSRATSAFRCATGRTAPSSRLIICHDGMFPEMARECAYKGAEIMIRTAGYTAPIRHAWHITNQANAFCNLMPRRVSACAAATARSIRWARR